MSKEEINLMREAMHKGVKMLVEEMEKYARENKSVSDDEHVRHIKGHEQGREKSRRGKLL